MILLMGTMQKMNLVATTNCKDNLSDSDTIDKQKKDSMLDQNKSDKSEVERTDNRCDPGTAKTTFILYNAGNNEESHDDILSKIDSVLLESKDSDNVHSKQNVGDPALD